MNDLQQMKILIIDDSRDSIDLTEHILKKGGYENIRAVSSAKEGTAIMNHELPDLLLLDIIMPDINGLEFCKKFKTAPDTKNIPVIMVSGSFQDSDEALQKAFNVGAMDFIPKPLRTPEVLARVKSALSLKQANDSIQEELSKSNLFSDKLQTALGFVDSIIETSLCSIVVTDSKGGITRVNDSYLLMLGYEMEEIIDKHTVELSPREVGLYETSAGEKVQIEEDFFKSSRKMVEKLFEQGKVRRTKGYVLRKDGKIVITEENNVLIYNQQKEVIAAASIIQDITERKTKEEEREKLLAELQKALEEVKTIKGIIPICMHCKGIRDDKGAWTQLEKFIAEHSEAEFSHGICEKCLEKYYPEEYEELHKP